MAFGAAVPVESTNVRTVQYDPEGQILRVTFDSGVYDYAGVTEYEYGKLTGAPSIGSYLHHNIKRKHDVTRVQ